MLRLKSLTSREVIKRIRGQSLLLTLFTDEFSPAIAHPPDRAVPIFAEKEAGIPCDGDSTGRPQTFPSGMTKPVTKPSYIAARSHVVAVVEARRRYAFARGNQFVASAIAVTAIHLSLHRLSQPDAENGMRFRTTGATTGH